MTMDFNSIFLMMLPFWAGMAFINAKVIIEVNKQWGSQKQMINKILKS